MRLHVLSKSPISSNILTVKEAKKVLGTTAKGLSDEAINQLIVQVEALSDIVIAHANDSKIHSPIDILNKGSHTEG